MQRYKLLVQGIVQGIGFRPYIYNTALALDIKGFVYNDSEGVTIEAQGLPQNLDSFISKIKNNPLALSRIDRIKQQEISVKKEDTFVILHSNDKESKTTLILPDIKICKECQDDIDDPSSRYYGYFATNCTNCGPRYSIIKALPYDRKNTSMDSFKMCQECEKEYKDLTNRRFHAQPVSCPQCGPQLTLYKKQEVVKGHSIERIAQKIKEGAIVAIKGVGGFHIVCDATNTKTVQKLRAYKNRAKKPFALMCKDIEAVQKVALATPLEQKALQSPQAPIVVMQKRKDSIVSPAIAPQIEKIGVMLAYTGVHLLLFKYLQQLPLVATSANLSDEPIITTKEQLIEKLDFVEYILDYNREIVNAVDDSLVQVVDQKVQVLRAGRGYTPLSLKLPYKTEQKLLSCGANQKSSISIAYNDTLILSPHIGELESVANMEFFEKTVEGLKGFYEFTPQKLLCDKHPAYASTLWAKEQAIKLHRIQHHRAHLNAVKAEYGLIGDDYIGFIFDGTGYGQDGTIWGGEVFVKEERKYHFKPLKLLGAQKAIKEPKRVALAMLFEKLSLQEVLALDLEFLQTFSTQEIKLLHTAYTKEINTPLTSSVGRLFDAVAAMQGLVYTLSYEGESGLLIESNYKDTDKVFEYTIEQNIIDIKIAEYLLSKKCKLQDLSSMLINTLCAITIAVAKKEGLSVILSGGVFQNATLLNLLAKRLKEEKIRYYFNALIPSNDGGISAGQIYTYIKKESR